MLWTRQLRQYLGAPLCMYHYKDAVVVEFMFTNPFVVAPRTERYRTYQARVLGTQLFNEDSAYAKISMVFESG